MKKEHSYVKIYAVLLAICLIIDIAYIYIWGGGAISKFLFHDPTDCGNDFFNCIPAIYNYGLGYGLIVFYPPLAKIYYLFCGHIIGLNNVDLSISIRNSLTDIRMNQAALYMFVITMILVTIIIVIVGSYVYSDSRNSFLISLLMLGSYSVLFAIERGNIIYIAFMFTLIYCVFYDSENKFLKELAFVSLAIAAGLKLYPAAFGLLLITEKRWKEAGRTIFYGVFLFIVSLKVVNLFGPQIGEKEQNFGSSLFYWAKYLLENLLGEISVKKALALFVVILVCVLDIIFVMLKTNKKWISLFLVGVISMILGIQFAYPYAWLFLIPSFLFFFKEEKINIYSSVYFFLFCIFNLPLPIFGEKYSLTLSRLGRVKEITLFVFIIVLLVIETFMLINNAKKSKSEMSEC